MVLDQEPEMRQNNLLEVAKTRYSAQTEKSMKMSSSGNGFRPGARNVLKQPSGASKNEVFGPDRKIARAQ